MIVEPQLSRLQMLLAMRSSLLPKTLPRILAFTTISALVTVLELLLHLQTSTLTTAPLTIVGLALGVLLAFRNNAAYDRFREGRQLWGNWSIPAAASPENYSPWFVLRTPNPNGRITQRHRRRTTREVV